MPKREEMAELIEAHAALPEKMATAVWLSKEREDEVWLLEVVEELPDDPDVARPVRFRASGEFRYPMALIIGNESSVRAAIDKDSDFAALLARGDVLYGESVGRALVEHASAKAPGDKAA